MRVFGNVLEHKTFLSKILGSSRVTSLTKAMSDLKVEHATAKKELEQKIVALQAVATRSY
jgi:hypothetical protein